MNCQAYNLPETRDHFMACKNDWVPEAIDFGLLKIRNNMRELASFPERTIRKYGTIAYEVYRDK